MEARDRIISRKREGGRCAVTVENFLWLVDTSVCARLGLQGE